jgi:hypothetical protein
MLQFLRKCPSCEFADVLSLPETQSVWSAVTNRLMLAGDARSLQIDLVGGYWAIPLGHRWKPRIWYFGTN